MRPFPYSRSYENIEHLARYRGAYVGCMPRKHLWQKGF